MIRHLLGMISALSDKGAKSLFCLLESLRISERPKNRWNQCPGGMAGFTNAHRVRQTASDCENWLDESLAQLRLKPTSWGKQPAIVRGRFFAQACDIRLDINFEILGSEDS